MPRAYFGKKRCAKCRVVKNRSLDFYRCKERLDNSQPYCIECLSEMTKPICLNWYYAHREQERERMRRHYLEVTKPRKQREKEEAEAAKRSRGGKATHKDYVAKGKKDG